MSKETEKAGTRSNSTVYKTSNFTRVMTIIGLLLALLMIGVMVNLCINPIKADTRLSSILVTGIIILMLGSVLFISARAALFGLIELKDNVVLTENRIRFHLHLQTLPPSFKVIDDEVLWKDVQDLSFVNKEMTTFLVLTLISGDVKEFGIGHLEKRLQVDLEYRRNPKAYIEMEEELKWLKKKAFQKLPIWLSMELIGAVLMVMGQHWGIILAVFALMFGFFPLTLYHHYNSCFSNPATVKKGRIIILLGALLLVGILAAAIILSEATTQPA